MRLSAVAVFAFLAASVPAQESSLDHAKNLVDNAKTVDDAKTALARLDAVDAAFRDADARSLRWQLGGIAYRLGAHELELQVWQGVCRFYEQQGTGTKVDDDLPWFQDARSFQALALKELRRFDEAIAMRKQVLDTWNAVGAPVRAAVAHMEYAMSLVDGGRVVEAVDEVARAYAALEKTAGDNAFERARAMRDYARVLDDAGLLGDPRVAALREEALSLCERLPAETKDSGAYKEFVVDVGWTLARSWLDSGDFVRARKLAQDTLARATGWFGDDDLRTTWPRGILATIDIHLGDFENAVALLRKNLELRTEKLPPTAFAVQQVRLNYGWALMQASRHEDAIPEFEAAIAVLESLDLREPSERDLLSALYDNLGFCYIDHGQPDDAKRLLEKSLDRQMRDPVGSALAKGSLAWFHHRTGNFTKAEELFAECVNPVVAAKRHRQPCLHLERQARNYAALGKLDLLHATLSRLLATAELTVKQCHTLPGRPSFELAKIGERAARTVLALDGRLDENGKGELDRRAFALLESLRNIEVRVTNEAARFPQLAAQRAAAQAAAVELTRLAVTGASGDVLKPVQEKERKAYDAFYDALAGKGVPVRQLAVAEVVGALKQLPGTPVAIAFRRLRLIDVDPQQPGTDTPKDVLEAHVVTADGGFRRIDLGDAAVIEEAAETWLRAIEGGETRGRAAAKTGDDPAKQLADLVLEPLRPSLGKSKRLVVCLDDVLHKVPIEAMPGTKDLQFEFVGSLFDLVAPPPVPATKSSLFAIGGLDYERLPAATAGAPQPTVAPANAAAPPVDRQRAGPTFEWPELPGAKHEIDLVRKAFVTWAKAEPVVLEGSAVTREAFFRAAQQARFLHFATHGKFLLPANRDPDDPVAQRQYQAIRGYVPMALCLLALSGGNQTGKPDAGSFLGVATGEDIASLDLSGCELAVLSACETYQGESRPGHGLASLQAAFHAAGARYVLSTRWKVDDQWAKRTMEVFYKKLWLEKTKLSPRAALAEAQDVVRKESAKEDKEKKHGPTRHWAAFVLTGPIER